MNEVGESQFFQSAAHYLANHALVSFDGTRWLQVADSGHIGCAFGQPDRTFERRDNLSYGNILGIVRQAIPTLDAAMRNQKSALQEDLQKLAHSRQRQLGLRGQPPRRVQAL